MLYKDYTSLSAGQNVTEGSFIIFIILVELAVASALLSFSLFLRFLIGNSSANTETRYSLILDHYFKSFNVTSFLDLLLFSL